MYYQIKIERTYRHASDKGLFSQYQTDTEKFKTIKECKEWLKENYGHCKTTYPIFIDTEKEQHKKTGKIYCYKSSDYDTQKTIYNQDWITITEVKETVVLI